MQAAALQAGMFFVALAVNALNSQGLSRASRQASAAAVTKGGANPSTWAFAIWGLIYTMFGAAYVWYALSGADWNALPTALVLGWLLNAGWIFASTTESWNVALGFIVAYLACVLQALPQLTNEGGPTALLGVASGILAVWLSAATLLNVQIALPSTARLVGPTAPLLVAAATVAIVLRSKPNEAVWPRVQIAACLSTAIWVLVALSGFGKQTLLDDPESKAE